VNNPAWWAINIETKAVRRGSAEGLLSGANLCRGF
jgi:hypothetical protein